MKKAVMVAVLAMSVTIAQAGWFNRGADTNTLVKAQQLLSSDNSGLVLWNKSITEIVKTNVTEFEYAELTNGHRKVEIKLNNRLATYVYQGYTLYGNTIVTNTLMNYGCSLDPFANKVTTTRYIKLRVETYRIVIDSIECDYAVVSTVLKRWKTVLIQSISKHEDMEQVEE